jgi:hypothetical protein
MLKLKDPTQASSYREKVLSISKAEFPIAGKGPLKMQTAGTHQSGLK